MPTTLAPNLGHVALADVLPGEANLRTDGTLWSHAATLGSFVFRGVERIFDAALLEKVVANFKTGYPAKVPIDYEHETELKDQSTSDKPWTTRAGQIVEVRAVLTTADLVPEMKAQLDVERARRQRIGLSRDVDPLGLWVRWEPTARALSMIKAREVTEMSVVIYFDMAHKNTGEGQGPTLKSVALTNTPFLDEMIPVAASRSGAGPDSPAATRPQETPTMATKLMMAVAALSGKQAADEDTAVIHLNERSAALVADAEIGRKASTNLALLTSEIGVSDPAQAVVEVKKIKSKAEQAERDAAAARLTATKSAVDAFLKTHEKRLPSVPMKEHFAAALTAEMLKDGTLKIEDAPSAKVLLTMPETMSGRLTPTDKGANVNDDPDKLIATRADELLNTDERLKGIVASQGRQAGLKLAIMQAAKEIGIQDVAAPRPVQQ